MIKRLALGATVKAGCFDSVVLKDLMNVYELTLDTFGVEVTGGPKRFITSLEWYYLGRQESSCPSCGTKLESFRCPYQDKNGKDYKYWALACLNCKKLLEPKDLTEKGNKALKDPPPVELNSPAGSASLLPKYLLFDLEVTLRGKIQKIGAVRGEEVLLRTNGSSRSLEDLAQFSRGASVVVGHNLLGHDLEYLRAVQPNHPILDLPVVDTLQLSPLCFPENPYHRLVKDYKLVKDSLSDPVADARLAGQLFQDEISILKKWGETSPDLASFYRFCLPSKGFELLFEELGIPSTSPQVAQKFFCNAITELTCKEALSDFVEQHFPPGLAHAYILAWLLVAGSNSVLPHWVRHEYKEIPAILKQLRDQNCARQDCRYCQSVHDAKKQLEKFFDFDDFRQKPSATDGRSLQEMIVNAGISDQSLLAILPTGGGKSLGFQLPAFVRHYRRGVLTIVLSPLQALMKDQVENLRRQTGMYSAIDAIYGLQTLPERGAVHQKLVLGDIAILYVSPEQLRNQKFRDSIAQREIGCWVFDEAHCLSKWGHDFRPDYIYAGRFIRELAIQQGESSPPPIACFTATAKLDVKQDLLDYFKKELDQEMEVFDGGTERDNLLYDVRIVTEHQKPGAAHDLLTKHVGSKGPGSAVIFCATKKKVETLADHLLDKGWPVAGFHAGLERESKTKILDDFSSGTLRVICATNAFGMGVDKSDIRLVLHHDIPGSLENYIQEAGRAGRDQQSAHCILLYNPGGDEQSGDVDTQFTLDAYGRISLTDIRNILRSIRYWHKKQNRGGLDQKPHVYLSATQILDEISTSFDEEFFASKSTKVRTALANLENANFLSRNENRNRMFQGRPLVTSMKEAESIIGRQSLGRQQEIAWSEIYQTFLNLPSDGQPDIDDFTKLPSLVPLVRNNGRRNDATKVVFRILNSMSDIGLIKKDVNYSAILRYGVVNSSGELFKKFRGLEESVLERMRELEPDAQPGESYPFNSSATVTYLHREKKCDWVLPEHLHRLLGILRLDGTRFAGNQGSLIPTPCGKGVYRVKLQNSWDHIVSLSDKRLQVAAQILRCIHEKIPSKEGRSATLLVSFEESELLAAIKSDLFLSSDIKDHHAAIESGLLYLHESGILQIKGGIALFTQAMRLDLEEESFGRRYTQGDFMALGKHYDEKNTQIHVMGEYARLGENELAQALRFVLDYFTLKKTDFLKKYFKGRIQLLQRATSAESYRQIVENLRNSFQESIVCANSNKNLLVLAGPGSGKTRTVAHRCAYLLRIERIKAQRLLVLCYNRSAVITLRRRIRRLAGKDCQGITISTFHSLAMNFLGISAPDAFSHGTDLGPDAQRQFEEFIPKATALLEGTTEIPGMDKDQILQSLIGEWSHILIDEYQDIDQQQYAFVSAISGRVRKNPDTKLAILAVGDDDQNIYEFRGASTRFIHQFEKDYEAETRHLVENYRSTKNIISAANHLIAHNRDRMKISHPIRINKARMDNLSGGPWQDLDPVGNGLVQILRVKDGPAQAATVLAEIQRLRDLASEDLSWGDFAILGRGRPQLTPVRALLESVDIPVQWACGLYKGFRLIRLREIQEGLDALNHYMRRPGGSGDASANELRQLLSGVGGKATSPWHDLFQQLLSDWCHKIGDDSVPIVSCIQFLQEALYQMKAEHRYGNGLFVGTAHSAKGLEFKHVIILDGGWESKAQQVEEECRLYYVAMTRAMENLILIQREDCNNQFAKSVCEVDGTFHREAPQTTDPDPNILSRSYEFLGMKDVFLDLASRNSTVRNHVSQLRAGDPIELREYGEKVSLLNSEGKHVGTLSAHARSLWKDRLATIESAKVFAIIRRHKKDCTPQYQTNNQVETWEVPLVEIVVRNPS